MELLDKTGLTYFWSLIKEKLSLKADASTTLSGYGITDAYTKTEADSAIETEIGKITYPVTSVNGSTGDVTITAEGLGAITSHQDISGKVDRTGDTMTGSLVAQNNTNYSTKQVRNIIISTSTPTSSDGDNGDIWIVYEN